VVGRFSALAIWGWFGVGCAAAPPGPRGPLTEAGARFAVDWSVAAGSARLQRPGKPEVSSSADYFGVNFPLPPRRLEARLAPVSWADVGGDIGWLDGGVDVRFGLPSAKGRFVAANLALGMRSGQPGVVPETNSTYSYWARLEAYPLLSERSDELGVRESHRGVLALGLNGGVFSHQVPLPWDSGSEPGDGNYSTFQVRRRELRVEAAVGYFVQPRGAAALLVGLEPYWVASADPIGVGTYHQTWGVVLVMSGSFFLRVHHAPTAAGAAP
jgi:hypothetical protein